MKRPIYAFNLRPVRCTHRRMRVTGNDVIEFGQPRGKDDPARCRDCQVVVCATTDPEISRSLDGLDIQVRRGGFTATADRRRESYGINLQDGDLSFLTARNARDLAYVLTKAVRFMATGRAPRLQMVETKR